MKRLKFVVILLIAALAGFALGRMTGSAPVIELAGVRKDFPLFPKPPKADPTPPKVDEAKTEKDIIVETPVEDAVVSESFVDVAGRAKVAGGAIRVTIRDAAGTVLADENVTVTAAPGEEYGRFSKTFTFASPVTGKGTVEVSRAGGDSSSRVVRTVHFGAGNEEVTLKAYFRNTNISSGGDDCSLVYPVERRASSKTAIYRAAIEELLKGPSTGEKADGYATAMPANATLKSVAADANGVVTADFSDSLKRGISGECRTSGIRSQIVATLRQFPEVHDVIITVNGTSDNVLVP